MDSPKLQNSYLLVPSITIYKNLTMQISNLSHGLGDSASSSQHHSQHEVIIHSILPTAKVQFKTLAQKQTREKQIVSREKMWFS